MLRTGLLACLLAPGALIAQDRITLRIAPAPNQVIRLELTQTMGFEVTADGLPSGSMRMDGVVKVRGLQRVGTPDAQGRLTAELSFEEMSVDLQLNGSPVPTGAPPGFAGKRFTIVYGADGKVSEVNVPSDLEVPGGNLREMMKSLMGNLPSGTLAVGDSLSMPTSMALPMPGLDPGGPTNIEGTITYKLLGVTREGGDRIAALAQTIVAGTTDMRMTGTGRMQWNVDRGFVKAGSSDTKLEMTMAVPGGAGGTMKVSGTLHMEMSGTAQAAP